MADHIWRFFVEGVPDILLQLSSDGTILYINRVPGALAGSDIRGTSIYDVLQPTARSQLRKALGDVFERSEMRYVELPIAAQDGKVHWYSASVGPVIFGDRVVAATVVARDTTDQKNAELALRESEARYRILVEHAPEAIVVFDMDANRFVDANANACALFGLTREELLQRAPVELSPLVQPDGRRSDVAAEAYLNQALAGDAPTFEWTHIGAGKHAIPCEVRLVRLPPNSRRLVRGSIIDVSGQRGLERQIAEFQKLDTLGHVAGGIAHDFNNILTVITTSAQLLRELLPPGTPEHEHALAIAEAAARGTELTKQILLFTQRREPVREPVDLNAAIAHLAPMMARILGSDVRIEQRIHPGGAMVYADRGRIDQILVNLLLNARDAMPLGGKIIIETEALPGENACKLRIIDEGMGIGEATMARMFEPFFTTKPPGEGTGLGLSTTKMIVTQYGGRIAVSSKLGVGTTFEIILPSAP